MMEFTDDDYKVVNGKICLTYNGVYKALVLLYDKLWVKGNGLFAFPANTISYNEEINGKVSYQKQFNVNAAVADIIEAMKAGIDIVE